MLREVTKSGFAKKNPRNTMAAKKEIKQHFKGGKKKVQKKKGKDRF